MIRVSLDPRLEPRSPARRKVFRIAGRRYLDPGDRLSGRHDPPLPCIVITAREDGGGPGNVLVAYDDGSTAVVPFTRRLRRAA